MRATFISLCVALCVVFTPLDRALARPGHCQIEVINALRHDVTVRGTFDDGQALHPFRIYAHDAPHYIDLYYHGYCHSGAHIIIEALQVPHNHVVYNAWTHVNSTVHARL